MSELEFNNERDLVSRFVNGDQMAFEILFHRYKSKLNGFVLKFVSSPSDADDIVQRVFIKLWIHRDKVNPDKSFASFLFVIARHEAIDQLRAAIGRKLYLFGDAAMRDLQIVETEEEDTHRELEEKVNMLIEGLPDRRRQIFKLSRFEGLSYKQIAAKLGITENTVDTQIRHSLKFLRDKLTKTQLILFSFFFE